MKRKSIIIGFLLGIVTLSLMSYKVRDLRTFPSQHGKATIYKETIDGKDFVIVVSHSGTAVTPFNSCDCNCD